MNEPLSNLAHTVMVRNRATTQHDLVTSRIFNKLIGMHNLVGVSTLVVESEVDVNGSSCLVELRHTEGGPHSILSESKLCCS